MTMRMRLTTLRGKLKTFDASEKMAIILVWAQVKKIQTLPRFFVQPCACLYMYFAWSRPIIGFWWTISGLCICNVQFSIRKSTKAPGAFRTFLQHTPPLLLQRKRTLLCLLNIESLPNWAEIGNRKSSQKMGFSDRESNIESKKQRD